MINALNMELEIVRTVLRNAVNEVGVYIDEKRDTGAYYTVISIFSRPVAKWVAGQMAVAGLFAQNRDFVGSFTYQNALHLVFTYHPERHLEGTEELYAASFAKRKEVALHFLAALAETEIGGGAGRLLMAGRNVNLASDGKIALNYFLDFAACAPSELLDESQAGFYRDAAAFAFGILAREYEAKYDGQIESYPHELRLMFKKMQNKAFRSLSQIIAFVRGLPDIPSEQRLGVRRYTGWFKDRAAFIMRNPANLFLAVVVAVTLGYLGYQLAVRAMAGRQRQENTVFVGMEQIGEVYLGEENI